MISLTLKIFWYFENVHEVYRLGVAHWHILCTLIFKSHLPFRENLGSKIIVLVSINKFWAFISVILVYHFSWTALLLSDNSPFVVQVMFIHPFVFLILFLILSLFAMTLSSSSSFINRFIFPCSVALVNDDGIVQNYCFNEFGQENNFLIGISSPAQGGFDPCTYRTVKFDMPVMHMTLVWGNFSIRSRKSGRLIWSRERRKLTTDVANGCAYGAEVLRIERRVP